MAVSDRAGKPAEPSMLVDVDRLIAAYYDIHPDPSVPAQAVAFGTSGHRGSSLDGSFNENHILATSEAICRYRRAGGYDGPLFIGRDSHALSEPATRSAIEVLVANGVAVLVDSADGLTPTPSVSHAILTYNRGRRRRSRRRHRRHPIAQPARGRGLQVQPAERRPGRHRRDRRDPARGERAAGAPGWQASSACLTSGPSARVGRYDFTGVYVADLAGVIDMEAIRASGLKLGVDPLGGASVGYWAAIRDRYRLDLTVTNEVVDPRFAFMTVDWDGRIRMDPSSPYAMARLVALKDRFDVAFANDTDADRHGIVAGSAGLMNPNHFLSAAVAYLYRNRDWRPDVAVGKTLVSTSMLDRVAAELGRRLIEVPVGFKWFVAGLVDGLARLRRRGERRRLVPAPRRHRLDDRQGRPDRLPARGRADRSQRARPGRRVRRADGTVRGAGLPPRRRPGHAAGRRPFWRSSRRTRSGHRSWPASPIMAVLTRAPGNDAPSGASRS